MALNHFFYEDLRDARVDVSSWPEIPRFDGKSSVFVWSELVRKAYMRVESTKQTPNESIFFPASIYRLWPYEIAIAFLYKLWDALDEEVQKEVGMALRTRVNGCDRANWAFEMFVGAVKANMTSVCQIYYGKSAKRYEKVPQDKVNFMDGSPVQFLLTIIIDTYKRPSAALHRQLMSQWTTIARGKVFEEVRILVEFKAANEKEVLEALEPILAHYDVSKGDPLKIVAICEEKEALESKHSGVPTYFQPLKPTQASDASKVASSS